MAKSKFSLGIVLVGLIIFLFGGALDLSVVGLPAGVTADALGVIVMVYGAGVRL